MNSFLKRFPSYFTFLPLSAPLMRLSIHLFFTAVLMLPAETYGVDVDHLDTRPDARGFEDATASYNTGYSKHFFTIQIENKAGGYISVIGISSTLTIGRVIQPACGINELGFSSSGWGEKGSVVATAVNAIHIKTDDYVDLKVEAALRRGRIFSILPLEFYELALRENDTLSHSCIYTDCEAGTLIFGGAYTPFVGSKVTVNRRGQILDIAGRPDYRPSEGDILQIHVKIPQEYPLAIEFENWFGGTISVEKENGKKEIIGQVLKPVRGTGRFSGTEYAPLSSIRANHPGVICISTTPRINELSPGAVRARREIDPRGGFQIIPANHAMDNEMAKALLETQWMVTGPADASSRSPDGSAPLFKGYLRPDSTNPDKSQRTKIVAKFKGEKDWRPLPEIFGLAPASLKDMTHLKIILPRLEPLD